MKILFMCVANSARSQMAEGLAKRIFGNHFDIHSAGSNPKGLNPFSSQVMNEKGINISNQTSKTVDQLPKSFVENLDIVITLCKEEVCPIFLTSALKLHWSFEDPAQEGLAESELLNRFREIRDQIELKIKDFQSSLYN